MKRLIFITILSIVFIIVEAINWLCLMLDNVFFPNWRKTIIKAPVFIIGMPRTGSTYLHNLLYSDREKFTSMKLWEMLFCPSVIQKKFAQKLLSSGRFRSSVVFKTIIKFDKLWFKGYQQLHPTGLSHIEEDDFLLTHVMASQTFIFMFPEIKRFRALVRFDDSISERRKKRIILFLKKRDSETSFVFGNGRTYLSKCPMHTPKIESIRKGFPDSRFICLFREPAEVIPSTISLLIMFSRIYHTRVSIPNIREQTLSMADHWFAYPIEKLRHLPHAEYLMAWYEDLHHRPDKLVMNIYERFGYSISDDFYERLSKKESQLFILKATIFILPNNTD